MCVPALSKRSLFRLWRGFLYWFYLLNVLMVLVGVLIHAFTSKIQLVRNIYAVNCVFFYLRLLRFYTASENLGPKLHIIKSTVRTETMSILYANYITNVKPVYKRNLNCGGFVHEHKSNLSTNMDINLSANMNRIC